MDDITDAQRAKAAERGLKIFSMKEVIEAGKAKKQPHAQVKPKDILTFSYTSGTTGPP
jgi:long-subunit acyl-CoA synthetase (AMP-forming)